MPDDDQPPDEIALPIPSLRRFEAICDLLEQGTSLTVVSEFLKRKDLHYSAGTWAEMKAKRLLPPIQSGTLSLDDLARFLNECEEFGRNHTFLYVTTREKAVDLMNRNRVEDICRRRGTTSVFENLNVENMPTTPTLSQIRIEKVSEGQEGTNAHHTLTLKIVEVRKVEEHIGDTIEEGGIIAKRYAPKRVRAVNVAQLHSSGMLEVRISSHRSSVKYEADLTAIWTMLKPYLPYDAFRPFPLATAKKQLYSNRDTLKDVLRFSDTSMRNIEGIKMIAATSKRTSDLAQNQSVANSIEAFLAGQGAHCESSNIWWKAAEGRLTREIHMLLSGLNHEFAITTDCTKAEYEYVFNELRAYSREISG